MVIKIGKCNNLEFCRLAVTQRSVELPDDEPFICPQCSAELQLVGTKKTGGGNRTLMIGLQAGALVAGAGIIGWKLILAPAMTGTPQQLAPRATAAELALSANPDAPADAPAAAEPAVAAATPTAAPLPPPKILLRVNGPDALTAHLARRLAAGYLALIGDTDISTALTPDAATVQIIGSQAGQREAIVISASSSAGGIAALAGGQADVAMSLRAASQAEKNAAAKLGDITAAGTEHVIGMDGVAVITHPTNKAPAITRALLSAIFSGSVTDWSATGAPAHPLHAYLRDPVSNAADSPATLLGGDARAAIPLGSDTEVLAAVNRDPAAIGLVDLAEAQSAAPAAHIIAVADGANPPVTPSDLTLAEESYPLTRRLYLYTASAETASFGRRFADYASSAAGQAVVSASGFISLSVKPAAPPAPELATPTAQGAAQDPLQTATAGGTRLSTTFRFQPGSIDLDTRALRDVDRLAAYLRSHNTDGTHLLLLGFADNIGAADVNVSVAQKRAETVAAALNRIGITGEHTKAFGAAYPVADNTTTDGRDKNRRVEVYLMP